MRVSKRQLRRIIREIKLADIRDSTTEWYTDASGERQMVPGVGWAEAQESQARLAKNVSEYLAFSPPGPSADRSAIEQVAADEGIPVERVQAAVDEFGIDTAQWENETNLQLTERRLRRLIRSALREQVVGYKAPPKSYDDPMEDDSGGLSRSSRGSSGGSEAVTGKPDVGDDGGGYVSVGDMGVDVALDDSQEEKKASAMQVKKLTQQRQKALDQGKSVDATSAGEQLSMARKMRG